jgi:ligand-binding SRPBCC domain-containing protein
MTRLDNAIHIDARPEDVWRVLGDLEALDAYDPGVARSRRTSPQRDGLGAARRCELEPTGWFEERITEWRPTEALAFELSACNLPVELLRHRYTLAPEGGGTRVTQRMEYRLKYGPVGRLLDALVVRRKWDAGIRSFLAGLKDFVESGVSNRRAVARR